MVPAARFAMQNYQAGGRHPIGHIGVAQDVDTTPLSAADFDDPQADLSLSYRR